MTSIDDATPKTAFDNFEDLARKLFKVPKAELQDEEAKFQAEQKKRVNRPGRKPKQAN